MIHWPEISCYNTASYGDDFPNPIPIIPVTSQWSHDHIQPDMFPSYTISVAYDLENIIGIWWENIWLTFYLLVYTTISISLLLDTI